MQVGQQVAALCDGDPFHPRRLPDSWTLVPAADPGLVLINRYLGRSREEGEPALIELVDSSGTVLRSVSAQLWGAVGELRSGFLVSGEGFVSWDGEVRSLPGDGVPQAVLGGRYLVLFDERRTECGYSTPRPGAPSQPRCLPEGFWVVRASYDPDASVVAFATWDFRAVLVAGVEIGLQMFDLAFVPRSVIWTGDGELLVVGDSDRCVIDRSIGLAVEARRASSRCLPPARRHRPLRSRAAARDSETPVGWSRPGRAPRRARPAVGGDDQDGR